jgi:carboxymethylenebutenolidase
MGSSNDGAASGPKPRAAVGGAWIELTAKDGHTLDAYRASPDGEARGGIVIVQEIFGVNAHIRAVCDEYAAAGYEAIAPALFDRKQKKVELDYTPEGTTEGRALRTAIGWDAPIADIESAADAVRAAGKVATIGYCWGGSLSFLAACRAGVDAAVAYYGGQIIQFVDEEPKAPVLMHFGEKDALIPAADRERIIAAHPEAIVWVYPAGHGFNCTARADFDPESARVAKERTLTFLAKHVG